MDLRKIVEAAREQDWEFRRTKKGIQFVPPDPSKKIVQWHGTPSTQGALIKLVGEMRRQGFVYPLPEKRRRRKTS